MKRFGLHHSLVMRIVVFAALLLLLGVAVALVGWWGTNQHNILLRRVINGEMLPILYWQEIRFGLVDLENTIRDAILRRDRAALNYVRTVYVKNMKKSLTYSFTQLRRLYTSEAERKNLKQLERYFNQYYRDLDEILENVLEGREKKAVEMLEARLKPLRFHLQGLSGSILEEHRREAINSNTVAGEVRHHVANLIALALFLSLALGTLFSLIVSRAITIPVRSLIKETKRIAAGDLSRPITIHAYNEIGELSRAFEGMRLALRDSIGRLFLVSRRLHEGSDRILTGVRAAESISSIMRENIIRLKHRAEEESRGINTVVELLYEGMEAARELAARSQESLAHAGLTKGAVDTVRDAALEMVQRSSRLKELTDATRAQVGSLISLSESIGEIACMVELLSEQTQMLALNAEIEAAHAGKGGEGFAVIGESIGRLATRTREDAHRIEGLLEETRRRTGAIQAAAEAEGEEAERGQTIARELETAVEAMHGLVLDLETLATDVAAGMEELSRRMERAAMSIREIESYSAAGLADTEQALIHAAEEAVAVRNVLDLSEELSRLSHYLTHEIDFFEGTKPPYHGAEDGREIVSVVSPTQPVSLEVPSPT
ncbi:MAG: methyl-accepting chemotaxis protein [Firmicutes bacterium]|nr:methyl-accepting chemotaxis protein [Bacillota bacterium]